MDYNERVVEIKSVIGFGVCSGGGDVKGGRVCSGYLGGVVFVCNLIVGEGG